MKPREAAPRAGFLSWRRLYGWLWSYETLFLMLLGALVGLLGGLSAVVFQSLIDLVSHLSFESLLPRLLAFLGRYYVVLVPALGGLLVAPLVMRVAVEARGHGVPEVMEAVALKGGRIRPIVSVVKAVASSITIGTGGSAGREGPIVQISAGLGSTLGQVLRLSGDHIRTLVAAGAAAGIAATFNAPIAGVFFAEEVILGEFRPGPFTVIVVASVVASIVAQAFLGGYPFLRVPDYRMASPADLPFVVLLGGVAGFFGVLFVRVLYWTEDAFDRSRLPALARPAIGGLLVGVVGLFFPQVFGTGHDPIEQALNQEMAVGLMAGLALAKIVATSFTLGSGGSGGVFAPSLFIGAMVGGAFGWLVHRGLPGLTAPYGFYGVIGMSAVFTAAARAPITSILIIFEMTQDYRIVLPLMLATVVALVVSRALMRETIYTMKLVRRGVRLGAPREPDLLQVLRVRDVMTPRERVLTVSAEMSLEELNRLFRETLYHGFPVLDAQGNLCGLVTHRDLELALANGLTDGRVGDICSRRLRTVYPDQTLEEALRQFGALDVGRIPVVDRADPRRLVGVLHRDDIVRAYGRALLARQREGEAAGTSPQAIRPEEGSSPGRPPTET